MMKMKNLRKHMKTQHQQETDVVLALFAERDEAVRSCHIWQRGHSELVDDRNYWQETACRLQDDVKVWKSRADGHEADYNQMLKRIDKLVAEADAWRKVAGIAGLFSC